MCFLAPMTFSIDQNSNKARFMSRTMSINGGSRASPRTRALL